MSAAAAPSAGIRGLRTVVLTTALTLLVWMLAEARTLQSRRVEVFVELRPGAADRDLRVSPGETWDGFVELELRGPTAELLTLEDRLKEQNLVLTLGEQIPFSRGINEIDLRDAVRAAQVFVDGTVTVDRVSPDGVELQMDELVTRALPVVIDAGVDLASPATTDPPEVSIRCPSELLEFLPDRLVARVSREALEGLRPGVAHSVQGVPVSALFPVGVGPWAVTYEPSRVAVTLELRSETDSMLVPAVPVRLLLAPEAVGRWSVEISDDDRFIRDVRLSGPAAVIDRLREQEFVPTAIVRLTAPMLEAGAGEAEVRLIELPSRVSRPFESYRVRYRAERILDPSLVQPAGPQRQPEDPGERDPGEGPAPDALQPPAGPSDAEPSEGVPPIAPGR